MKFTVLGSRGFIGRHLVRHLTCQGHEICQPERNASWRSDVNYGHVIFCIGLTADFRSKPFETVEAHVGVLHDFLLRARFESLLYLSSTRVYQRSSNTDEETVLGAFPAIRGDLFNLSKLLGESLCLASGWPNVRVARVSNVVDGSFQTPTFLSQVVGEALAHGAVEFQSAPCSAKDYVCVEDVVDLLASIATQGRHAIYNVASGVNLTNADIAAILSEELGCRTLFTPGTPTHSFPPIHIDRIREDFGFVPRNVESTLRQALKAVTRTPKRQTPD